MLRCTILGLKHVFPVVPPNDLSVQLVKYLCGLISQFDFRKNNPDNPDENMEYLVPQVVIQCIQATLS